MKRRFLVCLALGLTTAALGHRLDEYLQATRVDVLTNRIELSIELTPGVAIVPRLLVLIDKDRDGQVKQEEAEAYAQSVLRDLHLDMDNKALTLRLAHTSFPNLKEVKEGLGVIRLKATAPSGLLAPGEHLLQLTNAHLPALSVYHVNALVPRDSSIQILKQSRDELQKSYRLEFKVTP